MPPATEITCKLPATRLPSWNRRTAGVGFGRGTRVARRGTRTWGMSAMRRQVCYAIKNNRRLRKCLTIRKARPNSECCGLRASGTSRDCARFHRHDRPRAILSRKCWAITSSITVSGSASIRLLSFMPNNVASRCIARVRTVTISLRAQPSRIEQS